MLLLFASSIFACWLFCAGEAKAVVSAGLHLDQPMTEDGDFLSLQLRDSVKPVHHRARSVQSRKKIFIKHARVGMTVTAFLLMATQEINLAAINIHTLTVRRLRISCHSMTRTGVTIIRLRRAPSVIPKSGSGEIHIGGSIVITSKGPVTDVQTREQYDMEFTISDITIKYGYCDSDDGPDTMAVIAWGVENVRSQYANRDRNGRSEFFRGASCRAREMSRGRKI